MPNFEVYKRVLPAIPPIIFRNFFVLVNGIIFVVVVLLYVFGNPQAGLFLGIVFLLNTFIGTAQDIHARVLLEKLQMLTALRVTRIGPDETEESVLAEKIKKGDLIKLKLGDQAPCEGVLVSADNLEISEALVTGESDSFPKKANDKIIAGAIVTSGHGVMQAVGLFRDSRLSMIKGEVKRYVASPSSIQKAIDTVIKYSGYVLILVLLFVITRGLFLHLPRLLIVTNAGALASTIVPQGLVVAITLLFAVGAAYYSRKDVLFQEINATEKLGRIKNLCIDKTGTLTDNILAVEEMHVSQNFSKSDACALSAATVYGLSDLSETVAAVKKYLDKNECGEKLNISDKISFSSWRRYGGVETEWQAKKQAIFLGAPDIFLSRVSNPKEKKWLAELLAENTHAGKRVLGVAISASGGISQAIAEADLAIVCVFVFHNTLRSGIQDAIKFFNGRGVQIRVLSGDNADTVRAVAESVGIIGAERVITGAEIKEWSDEDFKKQASSYTVFAQILPEQKVKLVEAFKKDGFTAMVGDGVNDALAMKKSDLGIAMFGGVPVTRQLADVILMTNSFTDLPGAVELADHFIRSIEISSGIYINQSVLGLFFFILISFFGYSYPLTPLNITFINYFTVGFFTILVSYWALRPSEKIFPANEKPFLQRVMPLVFICGVLEAIGTALVFFLSPAYLKTAPSDTLVGLALILFGFSFLFFAVKVYSGSVTKREKLNLAVFGLLELLVLYIMLQIPILIRFFNITLPFPPISSLGSTLFIVLIFALLQYLVIRRLFLKK